MMSRTTTRNIAIWLGIIGIFFLAWYLVFGRAGAPPGEVPLDGENSMGNGSLVQLIMTSPPDAHPIAIEVNGEDISATVGGMMYRSRNDTGIAFRDILEERGVAPSVYTYTVNRPSVWSSVFGVLLTFLPFILIFAFIIFILRQAQSGGNQAMGFGRSRAKEFTSNQAGVSFRDVAGLPDIKEELEEIVEFLKYPDKFRAVGARIPKGVLLIGPPGTGKTLISRAVAGEAGVPFFSISGSEFVEMFVGVGASRVRDMFEQAKKQAPCIIFIDEIDAVGRHRGAGLGGGHDEREQTLNQILVEMDGFDSATNIIIIAATNRADILDPALVRPGRFDRRIIVEAPDVKGRKEIIDVHIKGKPLAADVDLESLARQTPGLAGADLANLVNEAAILTARNSKKEIGMAELTESIDRVSMGPARKSRVITKEERTTVAYHESGHAVVSHFMPEGKEVGKVTIVARGHAGGFTRYQQEDHMLHTQMELEALIASAMGGRVAEDVKFGKITSGSSNDIEHATKIAREMVTRFGMSDKLGARVYGKREGAIFLGKEMSEQRDYSLRAESVIDNEIDKLLERGLKNARDILTKHRDKLDAVAEYLLENETAETADFKDLMEGRQPAPKISAAPPVPVEEPSADAPKEGATVEKKPKVALEPG